MLCPSCGQTNAADALTCISCGTLLSPTAPGVQTGHTQQEGAASPAHYSPHLAKGVRLQTDHYAVGEVLGQGGFGITYKGGDLSLRRYVALKEFFPQGCARQGATVVPSGALSATDYAGVKAKFIEEARTLARFSDPGIVRVFGVFEENNTAYMVMEFLEGATLSKRIADKGTLDEAEVINIAQKVAAALAAVHEAGLLHRDIKPDNICLTNDNRVVLIDFGTARAFASGKTVQQTTMLTPGYAPLEQYGQQARFGPYTDIYALAATLYHALTGQLPPAATDRAAGVELQPPHELNPRVSPAVSQALVRALQLKSSDRPQTIAEFAQSLTSPPVAVPSPTPPTPDPGGWGSAAGPTPAAPSVSGEQWFHGINGQETGPISRAALQSLIKSGVIRSDTMLWREGMTAWIPAGRSEWAAEIAGIGPRTPSHDDLGLIRPDTPFDKFMGSIPGWVWSLVWLVVLGGLGGRIALAVVRYQNGGKDFGTTLDTWVLRSPQAAGLTAADVHLGPGVYDDATASYKHDDYVGKVRYQDGDAGDIFLNVTSRDWLYKPEQCNFTFTPTDFGYVMEPQISGEMTDRMAKNGIEGRVTDFKLHRQTRTTYSGTWNAVESGDGKITASGTAAVTVNSFDTEGAPASWTYSFQMN